MIDIINSELKRLRKKYGPNSGITITYGFDGGIYFTEVEVAVTKPETYHGWYEAFHGSKTIRGLKFIQNNIKNKNKLLSTILEIEQRIDEDMREYFGE